MSDKRSRSSFGSIHEIVTEVTKVGKHVQGVRWALDNLAMGIEMGQYQDATWVPDATDRMIAAEIRRLAGQLTGVYDG